MLEWAAFDQLMRWRPQESVDGRIAIVAIDEASLRSVGQWPIPDGVLAQLLDKIRQQNPRAIGLDLYRDLPVQPGHPSLVRVFQSTPNLIGVEKVVGDQLGSAVNPPPVLSERDQVAAADLVLDADGKLRRGLLTLESVQGEVKISLATRLALLYLEAEGIGLEEVDAIQQRYRLGKAVFTPFKGNDGGYVRADDRGYQILLNFRGTPDPFPTVSMKQVLAGDLPPKWGRDRIILMGTTSPSLNDFVVTPYDTSLSVSHQRTPGVVLHAHLTSQIISAALDGRPQIQVWAEPLEWLWILVWSGVGAVLAWTLRSKRLFGQTVSPQSAFASIVLAIAGLFAGSYVAFCQGYWIPMIPALIALGGSAIAIIGYIAKLEQEDRQTMMALFGRHVTPKIAEVIWLSRHQLLKKGQLMGQQMTATVLFSDLKGFSHIATQLAPDELMSWLNEYMQVMAQTVLEHDGIIDKFIGDAVMALFGVPIPRTKPEEIAADAQAAVACAIAMGHKLGLLNQQWRLQGRPTVEMRVGIATGVVVTGSLGSAQRLEYTVLGDTVNIAARLESYDKSLDTGLCRILISEETYKQIKDRFPTRYISSVYLKGRDQLTKIYQVDNY